MVSGGECIGGCFATDPVCVLVGRMCGEGRVGRYGDVIGGYTVAPPQLTADTPMYITNTNNSELQKSLARLNADA